MEDYEVIGIEGSRRTNLKYFKRKMNLPGADPGLPKRRGGGHQRAPTARAFLGGLGDKTFKNKSF